MDLSKLQIVALVVLTTIFTDKFLINHNYNNSPITVISTPTPTLSQSPENTTPNVSIVPTQPVYQNELILKELQNLRKEIVAVRNPVPTTTVMAVSTLTPSLIGGMVKINSSQWKKVDVFERASASSKIINSIYYDVIYFYTSKTSSWYQLNLDGGQVGWVQSQFLKEYP